MGEPLTIDAYAEYALQTRQFDTSDKGIGFPLLGLFGETGSLLSEVKKKQRDSVAYLGYRDTVLEELGDVLWYLVCAADYASLSLSGLAANIDGNLTDWKLRDFESLTFGAIDINGECFSDGPSPSFERTLLRLAAEVGLLLTDYSAGRLDRNRAALEGRLIAVLRILREAAHEAGVTLESAAQANLEKIFDRWPLERRYPTLFDRNYPSTEQLPRVLVVDINEMERDGKFMAQLSRNGRRMGDPLTDNRADDDDYRFHDVFHLSFAAHLGWSPTMRRLLKAKRKSDPRVDEVEDGARAVLIEEGIATWIFNYAQRLAFFEDLPVLDYGLLKSVRRFVIGYEVEDAPLWLWEEAILNGYKVFRAVKAHRGGRVTANLTERSIMFEAL